MRRWRAPAMVAVVLLAIAAALWLAPARQAPPADEVRLAAPRDFVPGPEDAYFTAALLHVWEPLVAADERGEPVPWLAESWESSPDARQWTFTLRDGVRFHDGTMLDTTAVLANYARWRRVSPKGSPFNVMDIAQSYPGLVDIRALDDRRFTLVFDAPRPTLPYALINYSSPIFAPSSLGEDGNFTSRLIGTGPFRLVEHDAETAVLEAFADYWGEPAATRRIRITVIPDSDTRLAALRAGEVVGLIGGGALPADRAAELARDPRFALSDALSASVHHILANGKSGIFPDQRLREAVSLAVDRNHIASIHGGHVVPTANILNSASPFHKAQPIAHDPARAKTLAQAALAGGRAPVRLILGTFGTSRYPYRAQAEYIQFALKPLGLDTEIRVLDTSAFFAALARGDYDLALSIQVTGNADPYSMFVDYLSSTGSSNRVLSLGYANAEADALLARTARAGTLAERRVLYDRLQEIAAATLPTIPLFTEKSLIAFDRRVRGYRARMYDSSLPQLYMAD